MEEAQGSSPCSSTLLLLFDQLGSFFGGLVAGEGSFVVQDLPQRFVQSGDPQRVFIMQISLASRDRPLLVGLQTLIGGGVFDAPRRKAQWQPMSTLSVRSRDVHRSRTIPFMDRFLPAQCEAD